MTRAVFVMEQHIGHQTYYANLRQAVDREVRIAARWFPITYHQPGALLDAIPGIPARLRGTLHGAAQVRRAIAGGAYDVAFFNTQVPAALAGPGLSRRPYVIATDITPIQYDAMGADYGHRPDGGGLIARFKHRVNVALLRGAARVLPWSSWVRESLISDYGVDPARIAVVPPGVDLAHWQPGPARPGAPLQILFVGSDLVRKGGEELLAAFRSLPSGAAALHLVTRGAVEPEPGVHVYRDLRPNSPELIALYRRADVFVLPSRAEAFGIAAVEASAAGLPVIASAVGGLVDVVADGESGFLIPPASAPELADRLARLAADPGLRARMGQAARARAEQRFDAEQNAARAVGALLDAAAPSGACPGASPVAGDC